MKIRRDFVTNSSSASYIIAFARLADEEKATEKLNEFGYKPMTYADIVNMHRAWGTFGADWAGAKLWDVDKVIEQYPDGKFILVDECRDAEYDEEDDDYDYDYNFRINPLIESLTEENGFADLETAEGEGYNG